MPQARPGQHGLQPALPHQPAPVHLRGDGGHGGGHPRRGLHPRGPRRRVAMTLRGALLGAGNIALKGHAPHWLELEKRGQARIVALADESSANREAAARLFPSARVYETAVGLLDHERLDFGDVCTPPFTRLAITAAAARRGVHLLAEKPMAVDLAEAERVATLVRDSGIVFKPCHQYHHSPLWRAVRDHVGAIGRVHLARYDVRRMAANEGSAGWVPSWRTVAALAGGGILVDHGAHVFYQLRSIMGEARRIRATVRTLRHHDYGVEDTASILLDHGDAMAEVALTWAARRREISFRLVGEHGEIAGSEDEVRVWNGAGETVVRPGGLSEGSVHSHWYAPLFADFLDQVRHGVRDREDLDEALYVARVISCAYESSREERALAVATTPEIAAEAVTEADMDPIPAAAPGSALSLESAPPREDGVRPRRLIARTAVLAGMVGVVAWMLHDVAWSGVWNVLATAQPLWIAAAAAVNLVVLVFQSARWLALLRPIAPPATLRSTFKAMLVGFTVSAFVPARAGELARVEVLGREVGLSRMAVMGSVLLDHIVDAFV